MISRAERSIMARWWWTVDHWLLGAVALGDIGRHFPDTDPRYQGADSRVLLRHSSRVAERVGQVQKDLSLLIDDALRE
mgnify:CR=1 FL=1